MSWTELPVITQLETTAAQAWRNGDVTAAQDKVRLNMGGTPVTCRTGSAFLLVCGGSGEM